MTPRTQLVPVVGIGAAAAMIFNILPVFLGKAAESLALSDSATGWLATTYLALRAAVLDFDHCGA